MDFTKMIEDACFSVSMEKTNHQVLHEQFDIRTKTFVGLINEALDELDAKVWDTKIVRGFFGKKLQHDLICCYCKELKVNVTDTDSVEYKIPINKEQCFILAFRKSDCQMVLYYAVYANWINNKKACTQIGEFNSCEEFLKLMLPDIIRSKQ